MNTTDRRKTDIAAIIASLTAQAEIDTAEPPSPTVTPRADRIRERLSPLSARLAAALEKIPVEVRDDGLHMDEVQPLVIGRQRSKPQAHAVAAAMASLGWQRRRFYRENHPSITLWFPPAPVGDIKKGKSS